jgi:hypothetical protein
MAQGRSLADLRARREALVRSMDASRVQLAASLQGAAGHLPELEATRQWIGDHPALSTIGAFVAGIALPILVPPAAPQRSGFWAELLGPLVQEGLHTALAMLQGGAPEALPPGAEAPARIAPPTPPAPPRG